MKKLVFNKILDGNVFPIGGYCGIGIDYDMYDSINEQHINYIKDLGLNFMIRMDDIKTEIGKKVAKLYSDNDIGCFFEDDRIANISENIKQEELNQNISEWVKDYKDYPCFLGPYFFDEPPRNDFFKYGKLQEAYNRTEYNGYPYLNILPSCGDGPLDKDKECTYEKYVEDYIKIVNPKFISFDCYLFGTGLNNKVSINGNDAFLSFNVISTMSKKYNIPFWSFVAAGGQWASPIDADELYPNKPQFDLAVHISLAFGAKGIEYFPFRQVYYFYKANNNETVNGLIGHFGKPNIWYDYCKEINKFIRKNELLLLNSEHVGVLFLGGSYSYPTFGGVVINGNSYEEIDYAESNHALVGIFNYANERMLYVVNNSYSEKTYVGFRFNFEYEFNIIDINGERKPTEYELRKEKCLLIDNIEEGEAIIIKYTIKGI